MPHASFCLRDKGHFSKRNIRSLFLVLILRTACHNAFTFCPYIWIRNPSCAFEEGMQTLFYNFPGHIPDRGSCSRVTVAIRVAIGVAIGWGKALSCLFLSCSLPRPTDRSHLPNLSGQRLRGYRSFSPDSSSSHLF